MDLQKLAHDAYEASKHWHLPILFGLVGHIRLHSKMEDKDIIGDLGDAPGDNILPKEILNSLISRRSL
ncbi:MAG: hypothetical protein NC923_05450 [Candidatus Omnitrophica bacterium]|nr:hypothetical protein [Candidatus Omnitrophota bacterium]